jgi:hypothetical protein
MNDNEIRMTVLNAFLNLTPRRRDVLLRVMQGKNDEKIAEELGGSVPVKPNTVTQHITKMYEEFQLKEIYPYLKDNRGELRDHFKNLLEKYREDIAQEMIRMANEFLMDSSGNQIISSEQSITIKLDLDSEKINVKLLIDILKAFRDNSGDNSMKIVKIRKGSLVMVLEGSQLGCQSLENQFKTGQLKEIAGIPLLEIATSSPEKSISSIWINLRSWFQRNILDNWEIEETIQGTLSALERYPDFLPTLSFETQMSDSVEEDQTNLIAQLIESLNSNNLDIVSLSAQKLGDIGNNSPEILEALKAKLETLNEQETISQSDRETIWQIALALGKLDPDEYPRAVARYKTIDLGGQNLKLLIAIKESEDDFVDILLEISPEWEDYLPTGLEIIVLDESGEKIAEERFEGTVTEIKVTDNIPYSNLNFWAVMGERFIVRITLTNNSIEEKLNI